MTDAGTPEPGPSPQRRFLDALPEIVASAATGAVDFAATGRRSAVALARALGVLIRLGADARSSRQQRGARVLETAAEQVGGLDRLADAATSDEARLELTARMIEAAMRTTHEQKIRALGRVLANGLDGHATVDLAQILTAALDAIEAPHVQVLAALRDNADAHGAADAHGEVMPHEDRVELLALTNEAIADRLPGHKPVLGALTQVLDGHNLIDPVSSGMSYGSWGGPGRWAISALGRALLVRLEEV